MTTCHSYRSSSLTPAGGVSIYFGWGLYGFNLGSALVAHSEFSPVAALEFGPNDLVLGPLKEHAIQQVGSLSDDLSASLATLPHPCARVDAPLPMGLGKDLYVVTSIGGRLLTRQTTIASNTAP